MNYYALTNRYRGTEHRKALGCLLMALPAALISGVGWGWFWYSTGLFAPFLYVLLANLLSSFLCLMWWHKSDYWRFPDRMTRQWMWKGLVAFGLLGNPFGYELQKLGAVYAENFTSSKEDKEAIERAEGRAWGEYSFLTACVHFVAALILASVL